MSQSMPNELLVKIFTGLDYFTLKRVSGTCRHFRNIINDALQNNSNDEVKKTLFSEKFDPGASERTIEEALSAPDIIIMPDFEVHPCLAALQIRKIEGCEHSRGQPSISLAIDDIGFRTSSGFLSIADTSMAKEAATSSGKQHILIKLRLDYPADDVSETRHAFVHRDERAITVLDIAQELGQLIDGRDTCCSLAHNHGQMFTGITTKTVVDYVPEWSSRAEAAIVFDMEFLHPDVVG